MLTCFSPYAGRLIDHLEQGNTNLHRVTYLVLDEADRMLVSEHTRVAAIEDCLSNQPISNPLSSSLSS
jgi:hypothetical protein